MKAKKNVIFNEISIVGLTSEEASKVSGGTRGEDIRRVIVWVGTGLACAAAGAGAGVVAVTISIVAAAPAIIVGAVVGLVIVPATVAVSQRLKGERNVL